MDIGLILAAMIGMGEIFKKRGLRPELIPLLNVVTGIIAQLALNGLNWSSVGYGFVIGAVASGLYDQTKICKLFKKDGETGLS